MRNTGTQSHVRAVARTAVLLICVCLVAAILCGPADATTVWVSRVGNSNVEVIISGRIMTLQIGETSPEGVRLVSTEGGAAILEVEKRRVRVGVGSQVTVTPFWAVWLFGGGVHGVVVGIPLGLIPLFFGLRLGRPKLGTIGCVATVAAGFIYGAFGAVVVSLAFVIVFVSGLPKLQTFLQAQRRPWPMMRNGLLLIAAGFALAGVLLPYENPRDASLAGYAITILAIPMFLGGVGLLIVGVISSFTRKG